jgi:hypothetical protein
MMGLLLFAVIWRLPVMRKFVLLLVLFAAGCMTADEGECPEPKVVTVWDTVEVVKHDTIRMIASPPDASVLFGAWSASYVGSYSNGSPKQFVLAFVFTRPSSFSDTTLGVVANFTASRFEGGNPANPSTFNGKIVSSQDGIFEVEWSFNKCNWLVSMENGKMSLQQVGTGFFLTPFAIEFSR